MYLNCKTYFSFRYGCFATEELVKAAVEAGANTLAITNINATCDVWDFVQYCRQHGIKPIAGAEIRNGHRFLYILLARNNKGFKLINEFITAGLRSKQDFPEKADFFGSSEDVFVIYPLGAKEPVQLLCNELIGVLPAEVNKLYGISMKGLQGKFVIRQPVTFQNKVYYNVHKLLRAIDDNVLLSRLPPDSVAGADEYFVLPARLLEIFRQYPFIVTKTYKIMDACGIEMEFGTDKNKKVFSASPEDDRVLLRKLSQDGLINRYGIKNEKAAERVEKELKIIDQLGFNSYFLITWDLIRYAQSRGFYYVGRGSGANSIVAYCLQITDVDPIELDLYFERFLNPYRTSPPDFDIDFSWKDRDEVIDYVFKRYGREYVALLGMYSTFQYNAIIRELGKVFGLPKSEIDQLAEKGYYNGESRGENFAKKQDEDKIHRTILQYGKLMQNFPSHLSIHPGGMLISEEPIAIYAALDLPPKGFPTAQMDMFVAENIGLYKLDILSQRGLGHIKECLRLMKENRQIDVNIHDIEKFKKDPVIRNQIRTVNTIGCFYIESPAMRHLLKKLECDDYLTLVAASSIIRPGVGRSGMMQQYIYRYHNPDKIEYLHPKLEELLKQTYGVMVYQEDVIKVAHYFAGLDMGEADILRRAMSGKYRSNHKFALIRDKFFANCKEFGYADDITAEVWRQMESFGGYSFSKAHSASFAVESYQSLYLKTYFPMEFMVAVINNFGGFYSRELYFYELMKTGARVHPPCVNRSDYLTNIEGNESHVGFIHIKAWRRRWRKKSLRKENDPAPTCTCRILLNEPDNHGTIEYTDPYGAFRFTGKNKKELLWEANFLQKKNKTHVPQHHSLFLEKPKEFTLPALPIYPLDDWYDEVELLGFPVRDPFEGVDDDPSKYVPAGELKNHVGEIVTVLGYHITQKPVRTVKGETMSFGTFIDSHKDWIDTVHFPQVYHMAPPQSGFFRITGKVIEEFKVNSIEVTYIEKAGIKKRMDSSI